MKNSFLKSFFFGIFAITVLITNTLRCDVIVNINSGDAVSLRPTAHFQDHDLAGYYEKVRSDSHPGGLVATGNQWCFLIKKAGRETWHLSKTDKKTKTLSYGDTITLKSRYSGNSANGNFLLGGYLCAEPEHKGYSVSVDRERADEWETWTLVNPHNKEDKSSIPNNGKVALKSKWDTFLCADSNKNIIADRKAIGTWEIWTIESLGHDQSYGPNAD